MRMLRWFLYSFLIVVTLCYGALLLFDTDFTVQDIGRHLMNGSVLLQGDMRVLFTNFYSYISPEHFVVNHHWLSGVVFTLLFRVGGIRALYMLQFLVFMLMFFLMYFFLRKKGGFTVGTLFMLPYVVWMASRLEIRPEMFGNLFIVIYLIVFDTFHRRRAVRPKSALLLVMLQLLWVNLHISFVFGLFIAGAHAAYAVLKHGWKKSRQWVILVALLALVSFANPNGLNGFLVPLNIFRDYGYTIVENMNLWFLHTRIPGPQISLYFISVPFFLAGLVWLRKHVTLLDVLFVFTGTVLGYMAHRNVPVFVLFTFPVAAKMLGELKNRIVTSPLSESASVLVVTGVVVANLLFPLAVFSGEIVPGFSLKHATADVVPGQFAASDAFKEMDVEGNMFNNYDIGSYLVYTLYPKWRVFVDNRPEAYGKEFFKTIYLPMQQDSNVWKEQLAKHDFQTIFWGHRDYTSWAQAFLFDRLKDDDWVPVYVDAYAIIFVRNIPEHAGVIGQHRVSQDVLQEFLSPSFHDAFTQ